MEEKKKPIITAGKVVTAIFILLIAAVAFLGPMYHEEFIGKVYQLTNNIMEMNEPPSNVENSQFIGTWESMTWISSRGLEYSGNEKTNDGSIITLNPDGTYTSKYYGSGKWWETDTGIKIRSSNETNYNKFTFKEGYILDNDMNTTINYADGTSSVEKYGDPYVKVE